MVNILIGDDHAVFRRGLREVLLEHLPSAHIEESSTGTEMVQKATGRSWDVFLMDITMPGKSGDKLVQELRRVRPSTPVLVLSVHPESTYAIPMLRAGAKGYLNKATSPDHLVAAIQSVISGRRYISDEVANCLFECMQTPHTDGRHAKLSQRESTTLRYLALGKPLKSIASEFGISVNTVSTYRTRLLKKLGISSNAALTRYAIEHGLLE